MKICIKKVCGSWFPVNIEFQFRKSVNKSHGNSNRNVAHDTKKETLYDTNID